MPKQVLLVEDDEIISDIYARTLAKAGFRVVIAKDGQAGLERIQTLAPDLIVLDLIMPNMSGMEFLEAYRQTSQGSDVQVVIVSNLSSDIEQQRSQELGVVAYLIKSHYTPDEMVNKIRAVTT